MAVKPGYKQTEVGKIPEDWKACPLFQLARIERGKFTARPRNDPKYYGGDIPFIQTGDVTNSNGRIRHFSQTLNKAGLQVSKQFPKGTIFFTIAANIGDVGVCEFDTACPDSLVAFSPYSSVSSEWLALELRSRKRLFENLASQNAQANLNLEKIRPSLVALPPTKAEQEAIAEALSDADALIESLEQLIAKKRQIKQGAMQQLLTGQKRLPGFTGEWELTTLKSKGQVYGGLTGKTKSDFEGGNAYYIPFIDVMNKACIDSRNWGRVKVSQVESQNKVERGDLIFNGSSETPEEVAMCSEIVASSELLYLNSFCFGYRPFDISGVFSRYLAYFFRSKVGRELASSLAQGSTRYNISKVALVNTPFRIPQFAEQTAIAETLSDMDEEIAALEAKLSKARQLKQGMMQELLTGRVRLI